MSQWRSAYTIWKGSVISWRGGESEETGEVQGNVMMKHVIYGGYREIPSTVGKRWPLKLTTTVTGGP